LLQEKNMQEEKIKNKPNMLEDGEIEVWQVRGTPDFGLLSQDEKSKLKGISGQDMRETFLLSRCAIRSLLTKYTEKPSAEKCVDTHPGGKPFFVNHPDLHFSLSHSGGEVAMAFSRTPIGFDMEKKGRHADFVPVARRFFSAAEAAQIAAAGEHASSLFLNLWTAKEAILKLEGSGISGGLERALVWNDSEGELDGRRVHLHRMEWPGYIARVASFEEPRAVRLQELIF
jgi:phosphopantetheine--protein transferase-like protein